MKYFEKIAVDFGTTRKLLREMKSKGIKYSRSKKESLYMPLSNRIRVSKKSNNPRMDLFHEYGHSQDRKALIKEVAERTAIAGTLSMRKLFKKKNLKSEKYINSLENKAITMGSEIRANDNAIKYMKDNKVSSDLIDLYKGSLANSYSTYKRNMNSTLMGVKKDPAIRTAARTLSRTKKHIGRAELPTLIRSIKRNNIKKGLSIKINKPPEFHENIERYSPLLSSKGYN